MSTVISKPAYEIKVGDTVMLNTLWWKVTEVETFEDHEPTEYHISLTGGFEVNGGAMSREAIITLRCLHGDYLHVIVDGPRRFRVTYERTTRYQIEVEATDLDAARDAWRQALHEGRSEMTAPRRRVAASEPRIITVESL